MWNFIKSYYIFFVLLMIVGVAIVYTGWSYHDNEVFIEELETSLKEQCLKDMTVSEYCEDYVSRDPSQKVDTFSTTSDLITNMSWLHILSVFVIVLPVAIVSHRKLKKGYVKNILTRQNYSKFQKKLYLSVSKYATGFVIIGIMIFIVSFILSGHFDVALTKANVSESSLIAALPWIKANTNPWFEIGIWFVSLYLVGLLISTLTLLVSKKSTNVLVTVLATYFYFFILEVVISVGISSFLLSNVFHMTSISSSLSLFSVWNFGTNQSIISLIWLILLNVAAIMIYYFVYRDKEKLVISSER